MATTQTFEPCEKTVVLRANEHYEGQPYLVRRDETGSISVFAVISRKPVNARGFYQTEKVYRTIKLGSANYRAAVAEAIRSI